jgi:ABC-type branched-subunit amino acid transport system ATPase component
MLEVRDLRRSFGGIRAVDGVDLGIERGEVVGLIGPNGAGKTTVFNVVGGSLRPDGGRVRFDGRDITRRRSHDVARLGLVRSFQVPRIFGRMSVMENMLLAARDRTYAGLLRTLASPRAARRHERELAAEALGHLKRFGLADPAQAWASSLSGGQRKLLGLAMTLMAWPRLLLLDEPAAGINPTLQSEIAALLLGLRDEGITLFVIEHNIGFLARIADRVIVMAEGKVIREGTMEEVRADRAVIRAYLGTVPPAEEIDVPAVRGTDGDAAAPDARSAASTDEGRSHDAST